MIRSQSVGPDLKWTTDSFHRGRFYLVQPAKSGHRSGLDAMLLAACVDGAESLRVADFGAGAGAAGLAVASRCQQAHVTLIERDQIMVECATKTLSLVQNASVADRVQLVSGDIADLNAHPAVRRDHFDWVIMNPPFNDPSDRESPHAARAKAHVLTPDLFELWLKRAATVLHAKGRIALIARPESLSGILDACDRRFGALRIVPVIARKPADAIRILLTGQKGNRKRLSIGPELVLEGESGDGTMSRVADELINGVRSLDQCRQSLSTVN